MNARLLGAAAAATLVLVPAPGALAKKPHRGQHGRVDVQLLGVNDFHGALQTPRTLTRDGQQVPVGGAAFLASHLDQAEAANRANTIRVHAGDMVGASPLVSSYFHDEPSVLAMNAMNFDIGTVGNHEFDEGGREMLRLIAVNREVRRLRKRHVRTIVVLAHSGAFQATGNPQLATGEIVDETKEMSDEVDVVVAGHTHSLLNNDVDGKLVVEAFSNGTAYDDVDLKIDRRTGDVVSKSANIVTTWDDLVTPDQHVKKIVDDYSARVAPIANRVIGTSTAPVAHQGGTTVPTGDTPLGNLIADAQREAAKADFAFMNPGGIRAAIDAGPVTYSELFAVQPFDNQVVRMTLTGADIKALLAQQFEVNRLLQVSGLKYEYTGKTISNLTTTDGTPIVDGQSYTVAVNSFIATGGDGFTVLNDKGTNRSTVTSDLQALVDYIGSLPQPFAPPAAGARIVQK